MASICQVSILDTNQAKISGDRSIIWLFWVIFDTTESNQSQKQKVKKKKQQLVKEAY